MFEKAELLHRDISESNILIYEDPKTRKVGALLIDWDLCRFKKDLPRGPVEKSRSVCGLSVTPYDNSHSTFASGDVEILVCGSFELSFEGKRGFGRH